MSIENLLVEEFPQDEDLIYLNHAAVAPWPKRTMVAVQGFAQENTRIGASRYKSWLGTELKLRQQMRDLINAPAVSDIALLKNTSEGISLVASGLDWHAGDNIVTSDEEFPSNRIPWQAQAKQGVELREISLTSADAENALIAACDKNTRLLTVSSVQYASGFRLDLDKLGSYCNQHGILFCVDAIQSIGAMEFDAQAMGADFVMADAHKWMLGPEGVALFYARPGARDQLCLHEFGWHMLEKTGDYERREWQPADSARRFECGSSNMLGIHATAASLSLLEQIGMSEIQRRVLANSAYLMQALAGSAGIEIITPRDTARHAGIVSFVVKDRDNAQIHQHLLDQKVICAYRGGAIRFSPHFYTPREKIDKALEILNISI